MIRLRKVVSVFLLVGGLSGVSFSQPKGWEELQKTGLGFLTRTEYAKAEPLLLECLKIQEKEFGRADYRTAATRGYLKACYMGLKLNDKREVLLLDELDIVRQQSGEASAEYCYGPLMGIGSFYAGDLQNIEKAEPYLAQMAQLSRELYKKEKMFYQSHFQTVNLVGDLFERNNRLDKAKPYHEEVVLLLEKEAKQAKKNVDTYNYNLTIRAQCWDKLGDLGKAKALCQERVALMSSTYGKDSPQAREATQFMNALTTKTIDGSLNMDQMLANATKYGKESPQYVGSLLVQAGVLLANNEYGKSEVMLKECTLLTEKIYGTGHDLHIGAGFMLGVCQLRMGSPEAAQTFGASFSLSREKIAESMPYLSELEKKVFTQSELFGNFEVFKGLVAGQIEPNAAMNDVLFDNQLATKAMLLSASKRMRERIRASGNSALITDFAAWQKAKQQLLDSYQLTIKERAGMDLKAMENRLNEMERSLSARSEDFRLIHEVRSARWQDVQGKLKKDEAIVEIIRGQYPSKFDGKRFVKDTVVYLALVATQKDNHPVLIKLGEGRLLETRGVKYYRNSIQSQVKDDQSYEYFWRPIAEHLRKVLPGSGRPTVYLSADGVYHTINVNTMFNPLNGKFVHDECSIRALSNCKDLLTEGKSAQTGDIALFGYPDYNAPIAKPASTSDLDSYEKLEIKPGTRFAEGEGIALLPGTKQEVEEIAGTFNKKGLRTVNYLGTEASEGKIKELRSPRVLHVATHGYFLASDPAGTVSQSASKLMSSQNPFLRSGLLLSGAATTLKTGTSSAGDDGILTAFEAMNLSLDDTELVVLSACETGRGEVLNGEGVFGLQRAFEVAGSKAVIMSLWKVDDQATRRLMSQFYQYWQQTGNLRESFEHAQLTLRASLAHPYYWGGFVLIGE
jgi:CHAT domain-containing protein